MCLEIVIVFQNIGEHVLIGCNDTTNYVDKQQMYSAQYENTLSP